jgi:hypothetical protein
MVDVFAATIVSLDYGMVGELSVFRYSGLRLLSDPNFRVH